MIEVHKTDIYCGKSLIPNKNLTMKNWPCFKPPPNKVSLCIYIYKGNDTYNVLRIDILKTKLINRYNVNLYRYLQFLTQQSMTNTF